MKTIGLMGGMSWESTVEYYRLINEGVKRAMGGHHSAKIALFSVEFDEIVKLQRANDWKKAGEILSDVAQNIESMGADALLLCTNTMHIVADAIEQSITIPFIHIADATADALVKDGIKSVGLLGTAFTMEEEFYRGRLEEKYGLNVTVPNKDSREMIHSIIFDELCLGTINQASKQSYLAITEELRKAGAEAIILGCTEIGMLIQQTDTNIPLYDTTLIHAEQAVKFALSGE